jgi:hypothetical protein
MMVEITYQMVLSTLQTVGLLVGIYYYVMTLQNTKKNQEISLRNQENALETRQAQLFMEMYRDFKRPDVQKAFHDIWRVWEWESFDDFQEKYVQNWDEWNKYMLIYSIYEGLGVLIYRKLIDVKMIDELMSSYVTRFWDKLSPILLEMRVRFNAPLMVEFTEYLYDEIMKVDSTPVYLRET